MLRRIFQTVKSNLMVFLFLNIAVIISGLILFFLYNDFPIGQGRYTFSYNPSLIVDVELHYNQFDKEPDYSVTISRIEIIPTRELEDSEICINRLFVLPFEILPALTESGWTPGAAFYDEDSFVEYTDLCVDYKIVSPPRFVDLEISPVSFSLKKPDLEQTFIMFPFDRSFLSLVFFASVSINGENSIIPVGLNLIIPEIQNTTRVNIMEEPIEFFLGREFGYNTEYLSATTVTYEITRPFTTKFLVVLIPLIILFYMYLLVTMEDTSSAAGIAFGIFIGLWSIKSVLIPESIGRSLLIEIIVAFLFLLFGWTSIYRFLIKKSP